MKFYKKYIFFIFPAIIMIVGGYFYFFRTAKIVPEYVVARSGAIVQEVSVTGRVKPVKSVDLAFEKSGRIITVLANAGNYIEAGDILIIKDSSELSAQLEKAEANLETQKAGLNKSKVVLLNYYLAIPDILNNAYIKADDAVRKQAGVMFTDAESDIPKLNFSSTNLQAVTDSQNGRLASRAELNIWRQELDKLSAVSFNNDLFLALAKSKTHLATVNLFLANMTDALEKSTGLSQSTLDSYKANIMTARANINIVLTDIADQSQNINVQEATILSEESSIKSYEAGIKDIEAQITKTVIRSPISGVVAKQNAKVGEMAAASEILISVFSSSNEIEANVAEADIAKIKINDNALVTLDAYGKDIVFKAKVFAVDPAETIIEGVATYKTTLKFISSDKPIKSGMTANIDILAEELKNVIVIPQRAVIVNNGDKFVRIYNPDASENQRIVKIKVSVGLKGSDGNVEITDGLQEGDRVITSYQE